MVEVRTDFVVDFGDGCCRWGLGRNCRRTLVVDFGVLVVDFRVALWCWTLVVDFDFGGGIWVGIVGALPEQKLHPRAPMDQ